MNKQDIARETFDQCSEFYNMIRKTTPCEGEEREYIVIALCQQDDKFEIVGAVVSPFAVYENTTLSREERSKLSRMAKLAIHLTRYTDPAIQSMGEFVQSVRTMESKYNIPVEAVCDALEESESKEEFTAVMQRALLESIAKARCGLEAEND